MVYHRTVTIQKATPISAEETLKFFSLGFNPLILLYR